MESAPNVSATFASHCLAYRFVFLALSQAAVSVLQMIEDVLGEGPVSASRFSQWFSSNMSPSGSRSSSLRSTPHEELERLAGVCVFVVVVVVFSPCCPPVLCAGASCNVE